MTSVEPAGGEEGEAIRLQRYLAMAGAGSRRHCEEFILTGRVTVDGRTITELGHRVVPGEHEVRLDGIASRSQALEMLRARARTVPAGQWIYTLGGWAMEQFDDGTPFTPAGVISGMT